MPHVNADAKTTDQDKTSPTVKLAVQWYDGKPRLITKNELIAIMVGGC